MNYNSFTMLRWVLLAILVTHNLFTAQDWIPIGAVVLVFGIIDRHTIKSWLKKGSNYVS